jgi:single-strand DNA-binding protein
MSGVNKVVIVGFVGKDCRESRTKSDQAVVNFSVAVTEKWFDANSKEQKERTEWFNCSMFGKRAEAVAKYITKGKQVYVEGRLQTRKYDDKEGVSRTTTEVIVQDLQLLGSGNGKRDRQADDHVSHGSVGAEDNGAVDMDSIPF